MLLAVTVKSILFFLLIIFFYVFTLVLSVVVIGVISEKIKLHRKMPPRRLNLFIYTISGSIWLAFIFLVLNNWAELMWNEYVNW